MTRLHSLNATPASRLAFGAMQFGGRAEQAQSQAMFDACRARGITHFDTAHLYNGGRSEEWLAQMIAPDRETLLIATKVGYSGGAGSANLRAQFDLSRRRLNLDYVDILYLHRFDPETDLNETLETFAELKQAGVIRYTGVSNFAAWQVMKAIAIADRLGVSIDIVQPMYNLVKRQAEVEILPMCRDQNLAIAPYSPLGGGLLTGKYAEGAATGRLREDARYAERYAAPWMQDTARGLTALAQAHDTDPATLAVAWAAAHKSDPTPIISARSAHQLLPSLAALDFTMTPALYDSIATLSPAPPPATDRNEAQI